jgi:hypothetical protein
METTPTTHRHRAVVRKPQKFPQQQQKLEKQQDEPEVNVDKLFAQMQSILENSGHTISKTSDLTTLDDLEEQVSQLIRENSLYGQQWQPDHGTECSIQKCNISQLVVFKYNNTGHLCTFVRGVRICGAPNDTMLHLGFSVKDDKTYYLCEHSGFVHQCAKQVSTSQLMQMNMCAPFLAWFWVWR